MAILLVRHARAGRRDRWKGDDRLRPLSNKGQVQARGLAGLLEPWTGSSRPALVSSPWVRCVETLGPLSHALGVPVTIDDVLGEGMGPKASRDLGHWLDGTPVVLCTHGDVIDDVLADLTAAGVDLGSDPAAPKGSVWVLDGVRGEVHTARYLPPPA